MLKTVKFKIPVIFIFVMVMFLAQNSFISMAFAGEFTFISMADSRGEKETGGINGPVISKLCKMSSELKPAFAIFSGDLIVGSKGDMNEYKKQINNFALAVKPLSDVCKIYYAFGNHDIKNPEQQKYCAEFFKNPTTYEGKYKGHVYSFDYSDCHFIAIATSLDGEEHLISDEQMKWLESDLEKNKTADHIFVFGHDPAYPAGPHKNSSLDKYKDRRDKFWALLEKYKVDVYFCGHEHLYNSKKQGSVYQILNGSCGAPLYKGFGGDFFHFAKVDVSGKSLKITVFDDSGKIRDEINSEKKILKVMSNEK
ncbi:MAG: metallophosphoesterase [Candidatus Wallbacteria bacterium]